MATAEERMQILKMIEEKKITAEEGARLLAALSSGKKGAPGAGGPREEPRWFRVRVTDLQTGRSRVSVNIPMSLVNVAVKMGARFAPNVEGFDFNQVIEAMRSGQQGKVVDVTDEEQGERVEIYVE
jgi:hypothetical protein